MAARYAGLSDGEALMIYSLQALEVASICFVVVLNLQCMFSLVLAAVLQNSQCASQLWLCVVGLFSL